MRIHFSRTIKNVFVVPLLLITGGLISIGFFFIVLRRAVYGLLPLFIALGLVAEFGTPSTYKFLLFIVFSAFAYGVAIHPIVTYISNQKKWNGIPTLAEYWKRHPQCKTRNGTKCCQCYSNQQRTWGWDYRGDNKKVHICRQCNTRLYRTW